MNEHADNIIETLERHNFEAYYVGGSVRNSIHNNIHNENLSIKDFDIVTNASYDQITKLFSNVESRGESFNVAIVKIGKEEFEIAQYRGEKYPEGGSTRPNEVYNVETLEEDVLRRDFKMNGIVIDKNQKIIDLVGGLEDIKNKTISTIGDPFKRFSEDPLRIIRAIRFSAQLNYVIEENTLKAMIDNVHLLKPIPHSRIEGELSKITKSGNQYKALYYLQILHDSSGGILYTNTLINREVYLLKSLFSLQLDDFYEVINNSNTQSKLGFYYSLYKTIDKDIVERELEDMQILSNNEVKKVILLLKHREIANNPTNQKLLNLVRDLSPQHGRQNLKECFQIYELIDDADFSVFEKIMSRPLFIKELQYNGNLVRNAGKKRGYLIEGKFIGEILEKGREQSVLGNQFNLTHVIGLLKDRLPKSKKLKTRKEKNNV